ncbi:uncharacterized protein BDZ83DRAFT_757647 [Colletotrichum acutatum]|uniref:Uncharacterized protein n=1 Tax=Glomerella acutata TaxID=27357 RepID=A0AAD8UBE2_GLOAC|nr:uncharacterized protein BDZ83DRAFT_757647 [Colletotrichum acutatum]KAK1709999.1 hypothetical protein BDZ83DRAFT_757647 [Colletotrichum acutatum]
MSVVCKVFAECHTLREPKSLRRVKGASDTSFLAPLARRSSTAYDLSWPLRKRRSPGRSEHSFTDDEMPADYAEKREFVNVTRRSSFGPSQFKCSAFQ